MTLHLMKEVKVIEIYVSCDNSKALLDVEEKMLKIAKDALLIHFGLPF